MNPWEEYASPTQETGPWSEFQAEGPWSEYKQEVKGQTPSVGGVLADLVKQPLYAMRGMNIATRQILGDVLGNEGMQQRAQQEAKEMEYQQKAYSPQFESETAQGLYGGVQSAARQAPAVALGIATGGVAAPLGILGADTGGQAYTKYRGRGATPEEAAVGGIGEGAVEIGTELLPMGFLVKKFGKVGAGQFLAGLLAREIPSEQVATVVADAIDTAIANPDKTWGDYLKERPGAAYQTLLATVAQSGVMAGASRVGQRFMKNEKAEEIDKNLDTLDLKTADHTEALKTQSQDTIYVGQDQIASNTLGTRVTEDPAVTDYARAQVQDRLGEQPPKKFSYWEPNQQELFDPLSGPHYPDEKSAGQQSLDLRTPSQIPGQEKIEGASPAEISSESIETLYHGGRRFTVWDPSTIGTGEGMAFQANGPGLYAGDTKTLAKMYVKYGGENGGLSELQVDTSRFIDPSKELTPEQKAAYDRAVAALDKLGLKASSRGLRAALRSVERFEREAVRKAMISAGIDGIRERLNDTFGTEIAIFNPEVIKRISPADPAQIEIPTLYREIEDRGKHVTDADFEAAMAKKLAARINQGLYTNARKADMMKEPRKYLTEQEVHTILGLRGPASWVRYDPQTLPSYEQTTGEFDGVELLNMILDDKKFRGYTRVIRYIIQHLNRHKAAGVPVRFALDRNPDGSLREYSTMRGGFGPNKKWDINLDQHNFGTAHYDSRQHTIWFGTRGLTARTIIHESLHALTARLIDQKPNDPRVKALKFIYDSVLKDPIFQKGDDAATPEYGLKNLKEFVSEAFSNPRFQMKLLMHEVKGLATSAQNALWSMAEQVRRILGIPSKDATNTIEELMRRVDEVAEETSNTIAELQKNSEKVYYPTRGIAVLPKYASAKAKHEAAMEAYKVEQRKLNQLINISKEGAKAIEEGGNRMVDEEDAKARVLEDTVGVEHVAKDPVVDEALIDDISKEKDGSDLWAATPGALARSFLADSTLVRTGYRLLDNAAKRVAIQTKNIIAPVEKTVVKMIRSEKGEILHNIMMRELRNKRDYTTDELRSAGVSDDVIMAHLEMRAMLDQVFERMNQALADKGRPPITRIEAYVSSRWSGPWRANIRDEDGKIIWQVAEHSRGKAKKAIEAIKATFPNLKADDLAYRQGREKGDDLEASYLDMLELIDPNDPRVQTLKSIYEEAVVGRTENVADQEKHFLKKTGVRGFAGDRPWAKDDPEDMFVQQFEYAKNALRWAEYQKAVDKLKPLLNDPKLKDTQKNNIAYLREYTKNHLGYGNSDLFNRLDNWVAEKLGISPQALQSGMGAAKTYFYLTRLGLSVPFTIAQFIQPAITTPAWHSYLSSQGYWHNPVRTSVLGTLVGVEAATWHYMKLLGQDQSIVESLMDSVDKDAARWMEANGIVEINQLADIKRDLRPQEIRTLAAPFEFTIKHSEIVARSVAFMTFVQHLKQSERFDTDTAEGRAQLFQLAEDMTKVSMTDYRSTERALMFERGGLTGDAAATLHSYQINNLFQLKFFADEFKRGNRTPLMNMMFMQLVAAGTSGLWFIDDLDDILENLKKFLSHEDYQKWKDVSVKGFMLEHFNDLFTYGLVSKLTGTNVHTRMSAADQIPFMPFEQADLSSAKGIGRSIANTAGNTFPFAGTAGNLVAAGVVGASPNQPERRKWEAAYAAAPAVLQGPMENLPAFNEGAVSKSPQDLDRGFRRRTEEEKSLRNFGFRSTAEQKHKDKEFINSKMEKELARRMQNASERAKAHILDKNPKKGVEELRKYVDLGGDPTAFLNSLPRAQLDQVTVELERRVLDARSGSRAGLLKLKRYLENVHEKATPVPTQQ